MKKSIITLVAALLATVQSQASRHLVVAFDSWLPPEIREEAGRRTSLLLYESEPGTRVTVLDGSRLFTIADVVVPPGTLKLRQASSIIPIAATMNAFRSATNTTGLFNPPVLLDHVGRQLKSDGEEEVVLLLGPALTRHPHEPMQDLTSHWPSDGFLLASEQRSVYSTVTRAHNLDGVTVNWYVSDSTDVVSAAHRAGVARFWSLFVKNQGGVLTGYSPDLANVFNLAVQGRQTPFLNSDLNPRDNQLVMYPYIPNPSLTVVITNVVTKTNEVTVTNIVTHVHEELLPPTTPGFTGFGLLWLSPRGQSQSVDLDLHVYVPSDRTELSFWNTNSPHGRYFRDIRHSATSVTEDPKASWEFAEITGELPDAVWINFFGGQGPVNGELVLIHEGRSHRVVFNFPSVTGDQGADRYRRERSARWLKIDLQTLLRLP